MTNNKSWKAKLRRKGLPQNQPARGRVEARYAFELETIFQRKTQAQIYEDLIRKHRGDVPVRECWNHLADRREAAIITTRGAGLLAWG